MNKKLFMGAILLPMSLHATANDEILGTANPDPVLADKLEQIKYFKMSSYNNKCNLEWDSRVSSDNQRNAKWDCKSSGDNVVLHRIGNSFKIESLPGCYLYDSQDSVSSNENNLVWDCDGNYSIFDIQSSLSNSF